MKPTKHIMVKVSEPKGLIMLTKKPIEYGIVKEVPNGCDIPIGAKLYFHRNITKENIGKEKTYKSSYHLEDNIYLVPFTENTNLTFGYVKDDDFIITGNYSLLEASKVKEEIINGVITPAKKGYEGFVTEKGVMKFPTELCKDIVGETCLIEPRTSYLLNMEDKTYWAVQDRYLMAYETS